MLLRRLPEVASYVSGGVLKYMQCLDHKVCASHCIDDFLLRKLDGLPCFVSPICAVMSINSASKAHRYCTPLRNYRQRGDGQTDMPPYSYCSSV